MTNTFQQNRKKGLAAMAACYLIWGFQPLYFAIDKSIDTAFLLACRIIWAAVCCIIILAAQGKLSQLAEALRSKSIMRTELPAAILLLADWGIYLFAVRCGRVMECAMGYYIMPLVMCALGALIFKEKIGKVHVIAICFIVVGIILSAGGFGGFPLVTILLSLCFAVYSALKKNLDIDSIVSTTLEILILVPISLLFIVFFGQGENAMGGMSFARLLFVIGSGIITGLPLVFFAIGVRHLPLSLTGILQYVSPSLGLICSLILGEVLSQKKLISFVFIWIGVIIYAVYELKKSKKVEIKA